MYTSNFVPVKGVNFHYLEWAGDAPPVIFLPGFISTAHAALHIGRAIAPKRRVLAFDLRGRGQSDKPADSYSIQQHVDDLADLLHSLKIDHCILAGHSFGASLALVFAEQYPDYVKKLILFDGGTAPSPMAHELFKAYHENLTYEYPSYESYATPYRGMMTLQPWTDDMEMLLQSNMQILDDGRAIRQVKPHVVEALLHAIAYEDLSRLSELYAAITVPVLLFRAGYGSFGKEDQHLTDEVLKTITIQNLTVVDVPEAGHTSILTIPHAERDEALLAFVEDK